MTITSKIIITDTNIITDLDNANLLDEFISLDNVYMVDLVKYEEINNKTCNNSVINKIKEISVNELQIAESFNMRNNIKSLSLYDSINLIVSKDNNAILASGDKALGKYAKLCNVQIIRTLKIVELLYDNKIITKKKAINSCNLLLNNPKTRIPKDDINKLINEIKK